MHGDERTHREFLRIHPDEHPVSMQLFGHDAEVMREAAAIAAAAGADLIDLNMGCPVRKVCRTGPGAALLDDPDRAVAIARAAREGSGLPVTAKLRPGREPGDRAGVTLARRLVEEAGVAGIAFHPRHASQQHAGAPDYALARELVEALPVPVILSGGLSSDETRPQRLRGERRRGGDAGARRARQPLAASSACSARATASPPARRSSTSSRLGDRVRRGPPRRGPRGPLFAEVLSLVRGPPGPHQARAPGARHGSHDGPCASGRAARRPQRRSRPDPIGLCGRMCCCYTPRVPPGRSNGGFLMARETVLTPEGLKELKAKIEHLSGDSAPRGGRAHQGGSRVRRHLRERRVRRRQERAGDAREADLRPRGEAPQRTRDRREVGGHRRGQRRASPST